METQEECTTPKNKECQIPKLWECPPAPRKKTERRIKLKPPKNGYFQPPDLDNFFPTGPRTGTTREACA